MDSKKKVLQECNPTCSSCSKNPIQNRMSVLERKEYSLSGMCGPCQRNFFDPPKDTQDTRIYLNVPYTRKGEAKKGFAHWDRQIGLWYLRPHTLSNKFSCSNKALKTLDVFGFSPFRSFNESWM